MPSYDFTILTSQPVEGVSLVVANHEEAFSYLTDELDYHILDDGSCPLFTESVGDFISDADHAHFSTLYV